MASKSEGDQDVEPDQRRKWYLDRRVSVTDVLTAIMAAVAILFAFTTLDKRVTLLEGVAVQQQDKQKEQDGDRAEIRKQMLDARIELRTELSATRLEVRSELRDINAKLDRIIEKRRGQ